MAPEPATPRLVNIEQHADGWLKKYVLTYERADGTTFPYDSVSRKPLEDYRRALEARGRGETAPTDAVCIVPQTAEGTVVLIKEFRYPLNSWCISFPAGLVEPGESLADCVNRELEEETGYALRDRDGADSIRPLPQAGFSSTGMSDETVHVVFADVEKKGDAHLEPTELIEPFELAIEDIPRFLQTNAIPMGTRAQLVLELIAVSQGEGGQ